MDTVVLEVPDELREIAVARGETLEGMAQAALAEWIRDARPAAILDAVVPADIPPGISAEAARYAQRRGILKWLLYTWRLAHERFPYASSISAELAVDPEDGERWIAIRVIAPASVEGLVNDCMELDRDLVRTLPPAAEEKLIISPGRL